jgi:predicted TIM-barrel fold metal-dependent hydrolase
MVEFIDSHVHFIDQKHPRLRFSWLEPEFVHPRLGNIDNMKHLIYDPAGLRAETRFTGLTKVVNVQAALDVADPVDETAWLQELADATGWPNGIVAYVDLAAEDAADQLERHAAYSNLRGIRDFGRGDFLGPGAFLVDPAWRRGAGLLAERDLVLDLDCQWQDMDKARAVAEQLSDLTIILEHVGFPTGRDSDYFANWCAAIADLAEAPNVFCKVSGLGMGDPEWTVESLRPWVEHCLTSYGIERCLFGTNWPVDRLYSSYDAVIAAYDELLADLSPDGRQRFFVGTAEEVYRI